MNCIREAENYLRYYRELQSEHRARRSRDYQVGAISRWFFMWYVERLDKEEIAERLGYSSRQSVYDMRNRAIKKFAVALFRVAALEAI
ncbi:MAG: hypothetical protein K0R55_3137 [Sporomusa sp.]|jgi:hypothetical protein|nr:hypothetical protein [Sporomusa sp.]